jgi:hypothetical protein
MWRVFFEKEPNFYTTVLFFTVAIVYPPYNLKNSSLHPTLKLFSKTFKEQQQQIMMMMMIIIIIIIIIIKLGCYCIATKLSFLNNLPLPEE